MKKRRKFFPRRRKGSGFYSLELAILCVLLMTAAYVGTVNRPSGTAHVPSAPGKEAPASSPRAETQKGAAPASGNAVVDARLYRLARMTDGDCFELRDEKNRLLRVRLYGIDAPEGSQRFGRESREHLQSLMAGRKMRIKTMYEDNHKRAVALVYLSDGDGIDERSVNQRQIQAGMAWVYDYFCTEGFCNTWKLEEAMAQKQQLGLWKDASPTPPWQWRRSHSGR